MKLEVMPRGQLKENRRTGRFPLKPKLGTGNRNSRTGCWDVVNNIVNSGTCFAFSLILRDVDSEFCV